MDLSLPLCITCILLVRAGHLLFQSGLSRSKNVASAVLRLICEMSVVTLGFWLFGQAILLHDQNSVIGFAPSLIGDGNFAVLAYLALILCGTAQITGAIGERSRFELVPILAALVSVLLIPLIGHLTWAGLFKQVGVIDIAGAIPLHVTSLVVAILAARAVGPRQGKYNRDGSCNAIPGHSVASAALGALLIVIGFIAYLVLASAMWHDVPLWQPTLTAILAAMSGALAAMVFSGYRFGKPDILLTLLGMVSGVVSLTAGPGLLPAWAAVSIALVAGIVGPWFAIWLDIRWRIDDATGLAPAMGAGAVASLTLTPLLAAGTILERLYTLAVNLSAAVFAVVVAGLFTWSLLALLARRMKLRASDADEYDGLDLAEHDINAYPDFQQTMIKSHHLRQA